MVVLAVKAGLHQEETRLECPRIEEFPFSSERKRMTTIHLMADGRKIAFIKGAPEIVLQRCTKINKDEKESVLKANEEMAKEALRVLALGYKDMIFFHSFYLQLRCIVLSH